MYVRSVPGPVDPARIRGFMYALASSAASWTTCLMRSSLPAKVVADRVQPRTEARVSARCRRASYFCLSPAVGEPNNIPGSQTGSQRWQMLRDAARHTRRSVQLAGASRDGRRRPATIRLRLKSLLAVAVALPGEFGAGLGVAGWRRSLPLYGAVRGRDG